MEYFAEYVWMIILLLVFIVWGIFVVKDIYECTHSILLRFWDISVSTWIFLVLTIGVFIGSLTLFICK